MNSTSGLNLSTTNDGLEQLKQLFHEHFELNYDASGTNLLDGYRLDFKSFNDIFLKWIRQLNSNSKVDMEFLNTDQNHKQAQQYKAKKSFNFAAKQSYFYSKKHQYSKMSQMNAADTNNNEDEYSLMAASSSTHSTSSIPSISLSEDEVQRSQFMENSHLINEFENNLQNLADTSSNSSFLIGDLTSENRQLKQVINDLKIQLQNAEDTNSQMVHEIELQSEKIFNATRFNAELSVKLDAHQEENDYLRKQVEVNKTIATDFENQFNILNAHVKILNQSLKDSEDELLKLNTQYQDSEMEQSKLFDELNEQKVIEIRLP